MARSLWPDLIFLYFDFIVSPIQVCYQPALNALSWRAWKNILAKEFCFRWEILFHIDIVFPQQQMAANKNFKLQEDFLAPSFEQLGYLTSQFLKTKTQVTSSLEG